VFIKVIIFFLFLLTSFQSLSKTDTIIISSTTSTYDTGLLTYLNKIFKEKFNIKVNVISLGTGQAIRVARDGNAEILLVHHYPSEIEFMNNGFGLIRYNLMYNDYILVGPKNDKSNCTSINSKLKQIFNNKLLFISRGDDSGTHKKEIELWNDIKVYPKTTDYWYLKVGQGMGNVLLMANEKSAYTLSDRGTWVSFNKKKGLKIICQNFPPLFNQYGIIIVNPSLNNKLDIKNAKKYVQWLISNHGKELINNFRIKGEQLFFFNHH